MTTHTGWLQRQTHKTFRVRRRSGTVQTALQEAYVRDDVSCSCDGCPTCKATSPCLPAPQAGSSIYYVIPDTAALRDYLDCWDSPDLTDGIIVLASVARQIADGGNLRRAARLRALYRDRRRHCVLFDDLHHCDTASGRGDPLATADFYARHFREGGFKSRSDNAGVINQGAEPVILVVSDVLANACSSSDQDISIWKNLSPGIHIVSMRHYFASRWATVPTIADVFDSLAASHEAKTRAKISGVNITKGEAVHWTLAAVEAAQAQGTVVTGKLQVSQRDYLLATVTPAAGGAPIVVHGREAMNRALHGDTVAVRITLKEHSILEHVSTINGAQGLPNEMEEEKIEGEEDGDSDNDNETSNNISIGPVTDMDTGFMGGPADEVAEGAVSGGDESIDHVFSPLTSSSEQSRYFTGHIVAVLQRASAEIVACVSVEDETALQCLAAADHDIGASAAPKSVLCVPADRRFPRLRLRSRQIHRILGQRIVLRVDGWDPGSKYPHAHMLRTLGSLGNLQVETDAVLVGSGVRWQPFTEAALRELPRQEAPTTTSGSSGAGGWALTEREIRHELAAGRRDLRSDDYYIVSIDPKGCVDVDDAMHARFLPNKDGGKDLIEVGVHIADVSYFVQENSALDAEASARCTTTYLVDRRLDMLPGAISEDAASLRAGRDRLAVSVIWTLCADALAAGRIEQRQPPWFGRTLIRSRHQLEYQQAQDVMDGRTLAPDQRLPQHDVLELKPSLSILSDIADALRASRLKAGAVELESAELRFNVDPEGTPTAVAVKSEIPMMRIVAEMMIFANAAVAERIHTAAPRAALLRRHAAPRRTALNEVAELCAAVGVPLILPSDDGSSSGDSDALWRQLGPALRSACAAAPAALATLIKATATRAMSEAQYFCAGEAAVSTAGSVSGLGHFGLALPYYTHFTSPIRRYADVVVHRQLLAAIQSDASSSTSNNIHSKSILDASEVASRAAVMNDRHRAAKRAQKSCADLYLLLLLHSEPHAERAVVYDMSDGEALRIFVPKYHTKAIIHLKDKAGVVLPPLRGPEDEDFNSQEVLAARRRLSLSEETTAGDAAAATSLHIIEVASGTRIASFQKMQHIWIEMGADVSRAHGPMLRLRLLADQHPLVLQAVAVEMKAGTDGGGTKQKGGVGQGAVPHRSNRAALGPPPGFSTPRIHANDHLQKLEREEKPEEDVISQVSVKSGNGNEGKGGLSSALASLSLSAVPRPVYISSRKETGVVYDQGEKAAPEKEVVLSAVRELQAKAARYALAAAACDPRSNKASRCAQRAEECRIECQKLVEYLKGV